MQCAHTWVKSVLDGAGKPPLAEHRSVVSVVTFLEVIIKALTKQTDSPFNELMVVLLGTEKRQELKPNWRKLVHGVMSFGTISVIPFLTWTLVV